MLNRITFLLNIFLTITSVSKGQEVKQTFTADSIFIYKDFKQAGTTSKIRYNHRHLDSINAPKIRLSKNDVAKLVNIFKCTSGKRIFQQKYGGDIYYVIVYDNGLKKRFVIYTSLKYGGLEDLDSMKRWLLQGEEKKKQLYDFCLGW